MLSVILPAYNEEQMIPLTVSTLGRVLGDTVPYELLFVDDGSKDHTWDILCQQAEQDPMWSGCISAGISARRPPCLRDWSAAKGDCCVVNGL